MVDHLQLVLGTKKALDEVESDSSVPTKVTLDSLLEIQEELGGKIEALKENME